MKLEPRVVAFAVVAGVRDDTDRPVVEHEEDRGGVDIAYLTGNASPRLLPTALTSTRFRPVIQGLRLTWYDVSNHQCADRVERAQNGGVEGTDPAEANESDTHTPTFPG